MENGNIQNNIQDLFNSYLESGGKPAVTHFRIYLNKLIDQHIKPQCKSSSRSGGGLAEWKTELLQRFGGRGAKWQKASLESIMPTLERIENDEGVDASRYRSWIEAAGFAWIRFDAPRLYNGKQCAAFKVLTEGSTFMQSGRLHYIEISQLDDAIEALAGTPHSMKLEQDINKPKEIAPEESKEEIAPEEEVTEEVSPQDEEMHEEEFNDDEF